MENYFWTITSTTATTPTIVSGGDSNDNFIELTTYPPNPWSVFVNYTGTTNGTTSWYNSTTENSESTNESGFSAMPTGYRRFSGDYLYHGRNAYWWSNIPEYGNTKFMILPANNYGNNCFSCGGGENTIVPTPANFDFAPSHYQTYGFQVRCIKN